MKKAILLCYHGSKDLEGSADTKKLTKIFQKKNKDITIKYGYLQNAKPSINDQLNTLLKKKFYRIMIIPGMIFSGNHVTKDIPKIINKFQKENKQVKISISLPLIKLKNFFNLIKKNINSEIKRIKKNNKTILILVASNTLNVEAKKEMKEVLKKITLKYYFKNSKIIMIGSKSSALKQKILNLNKMGYAKFVLLPVLLFRGLLLKNCSNVVDSIKKSNKNINCILLPHLNNYKIISEFLTKSTIF